MIKEPFLDEDEIEQMGRDAKNIVAANVSALMEQRGWSQQELERRSGVAQKTVSNIVRTGSTGTGKLAAIAFAFGLEPWMMLLPRAADIQQPKKLSGLMRDYFDCDREGQEHIEKAAERESAYQRARK